MSHITNNMLQAQNIFHRYMILQMKDIYYWETLLLISIQQTSAARIDGKKCIFSTLTLLNKSSLSYVTEKKTHKKSSCDQHKEMF